MMFFQFRVWRLAITSLLLHPLRSMLTVLGIFIGVSSVVWLLAIGEGISREAQKQIEQLGATNIMLRSVLPVEEKLTGGSNLGDDDLFIRYGIKRNDVEALLQIPTLVNALKIRETMREAHYGAATVDSRLVACTPEYAEVMKLDIERGEFISDIHVNNRDNVCVLASRVSRQFFPVDDPLGKIIRVRELPYTVVGVMKDRTPMAGIGGSLAAQDFVNDIYIPLETFWQRIGDRVLFVTAGQRRGEEIELSQITFQVATTDEVVPTAAAVRRTMEKLHKNVDYAIVIPLELLEQARTTKMMFMVFMGLIAAVTLMVGGIGIMNIMLATVTERTREIGIRRALGARQSDITRQFLAETVVLSIIGGVVGILGGLACPWMMEQLRLVLESTMPDAMNSLPDVVRTIRPVVVSWSIPLAFGISVVVGVIFGLYPAQRAAMMDPIEALRHA